MNLKSMSLDKLVHLRTRVDAVLDTRVAQERRMLESKLGKLTPSGTGFSRGGGLAGGKIPPKYRNPDNPVETWAGRGLRPRWLAAALKAGKKMEHFSIATSAKTAAKKARPKVRRARRK
jgi:DNA-binding protein H-NS